MDSVEHLVAQYGLAFVFAGTFVEGETALTVAGFAAHQRLLNPVYVAMAAFLGAVCADQLAFHIARSYRSHPRVVRALETRAGRTATALVARNPGRLALSFRFLFGLRLAVPVALGFGGYDPRRFLLCDLLAAALWSILWTAIGFFAGQTVERAFGAIRHAEHRVFVAAAIAVAVAAAIIPIRAFLRSRAG